MNRALVIEDQKPVRESIGELLKVAGCSVRLIGDGQVAFEELLTTAYDLVTLDLNMPSLDGFSLIETIASQDGPNSATPVIVISAYLAPAIVNDCKQLGIKHFLSKPFEAEELLDMIRQILGRF